MGTLLQTRQRSFYNSDLGLSGHRVGFPVITSVLKLEFILPYSSSSTPTVPYSTADILYGNEVNGNQRQQSEDVRQNSFGDLEKSRELARSRAKELEQNPNNRRPSSKSGKQRSITIDSGKKYNLHLKTWVYSPKFNTWSRF